MIKYVKTKNGENSPYIDIGIPINELSPKQFRKTYLGMYSHYFKYLKPSHNIEFFNAPPYKFKSLLQKRNWYNIIYKITQIKNE